MNREHYYKGTIQWTGNNGEGTTGYRAYERSYTFSIDHKTDILGSSDPSFRGDITKHNPEDLLLTSLAACHMLSYLHVCSVAGVIVIEYVDHATGTMVETSNGSACFKEVTLNPVVTVKDKTMINKANELHKEANALCFIANSVNFPIYHIPTSNVKSSNEGL